MAARGIRSPERERSSTVGRVARAAGAASPASPVRIGPGKVTVAVRLSSAGSGCTAELTV